MPQNFPNRIKYETNKRGANILSKPFPFPVEIISQPAQLAIAALELSASRIIALDTESNSLYHYPEQLCLIQIASHHKVYIIDAIALSDLTPLKVILEDFSVVKIIHAADNDIRGLNQHCGLHIRNLFDTSIAARIAGITRLSLAALSSNLLGITIDKSKRLQKSDWGRRPLSAEAIKYAATDVIHLFALREALETRLQTLGRAEWVYEECARIEKVRYTAPDRETAYLSVKGARDLDERRLAILRSLFTFREGEARRRHRPPFFVLPDSALIFLATNPEAYLSEVPGLGQTEVKRLRKGLREALYNGINAPPINRSHTSKTVRTTKQQLWRLSRLKVWRTSLAARLSLDPSLLWPLTSLKQLAREPDTLSSELASDNIRHWQRDVIAASLRDCLDSIQ